MRAICVFASFALACCCTPDSGLPEPDRTYEDTVRSDCRSWLSARVRDPLALERIAALREIDTLEALEMAVCDAVGKPVSLASLRYKEIAVRLDVPVMSEAGVVAEFIAAAGELLEE